MAAGVAGEDSRLLIFMGSRGLLYRVPIWRAPSTDENCNLQI